MFDSLWGFLIIKNMQQEDIILEIQAIKSRNKKVEAEKAWETSWQRRILVIGTTYIFMVFFMNLIGVKGVFVNAMIPTF